MDIITLNIIYYYTEAPKNHFIEKNYLSLHSNSINLP